MITQPFVENSIEHGQLHQIKNGKIVIRFNKINDSLVIEIEDNGIGRKSSMANSKNNEHSSLAIAITEQRIKILNEKENSSGFLKISDLNPFDKSGTVVAISLPYRKEVVSLKK